jgi:hypothetical protein
MVESKDGAGVNRVPMHVHGLEQLTSRVPQYHRVGPIREILLSIDEPMLIEQAATLCECG